jgi:hypothetical protein
MSDNKLIRWLRGLAERQVTAAGSRATFTSDMYFDAADAIETLQEAAEKNIADLRLFSNAFEDGSASKDFCIGLEARLTNALLKAKGEK